MPQNKKTKNKNAADSSTANQKPNSPTAKPGFKLTKLGWIPVEWEYDTLRNAADYVDYRGKTPVKSDSGIFLVTAKNIKDGFIDYQHSKEYIPVDTFDDVMSRGQVQLGDVVITTEAPLGKVAQIDKEGIALAQRVIKYRGKSKVLDNNYFRHFLMGHTFQAELLKESTGSTVLGIKGSRLHKIKIAIPSLPEQTRIANCLSTWDRAITTTRNLLQQLDERKKGLMQGLLSGAVRVPGFSSAAASGGEGDWEEVSLGDVTERVTDKNEELNDTVVTISAQRGFVLQEDYFNKRVASKTLSGYYLIEQGQFAYNKSYSKGYPMGAFKRLDNLEKAVVTTLYICFKVLDNVDSDFLLNYFEGGLMIKNLSRIAQEGGRAHGLLNIGLKDFFSLKLKLPPLSEQTTIAKILTTADQEIALYKRKLAKLEAQKKGLMQQLLTGQKRLSA
jgi:type I restriction enzyme S subunit